MLATGAAEDQVGEPVRVQPGDQDVEPALGLADDDHPAVRIDRDRRGRGQARVDGQLPVPVERRVEPTDDRGHLPPLEDLQSGPSPAPLPSAHPSPLPCGV
jgi:hypothetical protein